MSFKNRWVLVLWTKVSLALEGLIRNVYLDVNHFGNLFSRHSHLGEIQRKTSNKTHTDSTMSRKGANLLYMDTWKRTNTGSLGLLFSDKVAIVIHIVM